MPKKNKKDKVKLYRLVKNDKVEAVTKYLKDAQDAGDPVNLEERGSNDMTALLWAAARGNVELVNLLVANKADVNAVNVDNWTCLMCSALIANVECVKTLIEQKCDVRATDNDKKTALMCACVNACAATHDEDAKMEFQTRAAECIKLLIAAHADVDAADKNMMTSLMWASAKKNTKGVEVLLSADPSPQLEKKNDDQLTSLSWACQQGNPEITAMLIDAKADLETQDADGWTPLMWASKKIEPATPAQNLSAEEKEEFNRMEKIHTKKAQAGALQCIDALINANALIDNEDDIKKTALLWAVESSNHAAASKLLQMGADVNHDDMDGQTALTRATEAGDQPMINLINEQLQAEGVCKPCNCSVQ